MIIDAHAHIYDVLAGYGAKGEFRPLGNGKGIWSTGEVEQFFPSQYGDLGFRAEALLMLMEEAGIALKKSYGQNFLVNPMVPQDIADSC